MHNDRDPLGGFNASFTFNAGNGDDTIYVGQPADTGGKTLDPIDILLMLNGQGGNDSVYFDHTASTVGNTLAFIGKTFTDLFPSGTDEWAATFASIFNESETATRAALFTALVLGYVSDAHTRVMNIGVNARDIENISFSLGTGDDVFKLDNGTYREAITVSGGAGEDTFNCRTAPSHSKWSRSTAARTMTSSTSTFATSAPNSTITLTYNGGEHNANGDMLRIVGDGVATGDYRPSATQARAGRVTVKGNTFDFTGVEPLVVNGLGGFQLIGPTSLSDIAIESIDVADMDLTTLVLHVLLVDGVISWRQQVKLDAVGAKETNSFGQSLAWDGNTLAVGASRSLVSITNKHPVDRTVTILSRATTSPPDTRAWRAARHYVEMRDAGSGDWEFRVLDSAGAVVPVANVTGGPALVTNWQDVPANKVIDTMRGLMVAFGANEGNYRAVSKAGGTAASFNYSVGTYPGVVYIYVQSGSTWTEQAKLYAKDGEYAAQGFGNTVALRGDTLLVGAPQDNSLGANAGAAYVFQRSGLDWSQAAKLKASDGAANDRFGSSVGVGGGHVLVGAPGDDSNAGAVYVFQFGAGAWAQKTKLTAVDRDGGHLFGAALAYVGNTAAIGAPGKDDSRGSVYVFTGSGASWTNPAQLISTSPQVGEQFGAAVAMNASRIVAGAPYYDGKNQDQGAVFVYDWNGSAWKLSARLTADGGLPESLAQSEGRANDHFGAAVTLSGDFVIVGAPDYDDVAMNQGAVYFFRYLPDAGCNCGFSWIRSKDKMVSSTPTENDYFGKVLAMNGLNLAVGIPGFNETDANNNILREDVGTVRFYTTDNWINLNNLNDATRGIYRADVLNVSGGGAQAGFEMRYHPGSRTLLVGAPGNGNVYVYANEGLYWRYTQTFGFGHSAFGYDMDLSGDTVVVGAPGANRVEVFTFNYGSGYWDYRAGFYGPGGSSDFGRSVAIDGGRIAVGAPGTWMCYSSAYNPYNGYCLNLGNTGAVFTYVGGGASWNRMNASSCRLTPECPTILRIRFIMTIGSITKCISMQAHPVLMARGLAVVARADDWRHLLLGVNCWTTILKLWPRTYID